MLITKIGDATFTFMKKFGEGSTTEAQFVENPESIDLVIIVQRSMGPAEFKEIRRSMVWLNINWMRIDCDNDPEKKLITLRVVFPKNEITRLAQWQRQREQRISVIDGYLAAVDERLGKTDSPSERALKAMLPLIAGALQASMRTITGWHVELKRGWRETKVEKEWQHEDAARAIKIFEHAPRAVAAYVVRTFLSMSGAAATDYRFDLAGNHFTGLLPAAYYRNRYEIEQEQRLATIDIIAAQRLSEFSDDLFPLLDANLNFQTATLLKYDGRTRTNDSLAEQRRKAAHALGRIAGVHPPTLKRLTTLVDGKTPAPWWVKEAAIQALGWAGVENLQFSVEHPRVIAMLRDAYRFQSDYARNVTWHVDSTPKPEYLRKIIISAATLALGQSRDREFLAEWIEKLPNAQTNEDAGNAVNGEPEQLATIEALGYLGDKNQASSSGEKF